MYKLIKNVIGSKKYDLKDMLVKIDTMWVQGSLKESERIELIKLARENALPENSYAELQTQISTIWEKVKALSEEIKILKSELTTDGDEDVTPEEADEYPTYVQPTGVHDAYYKGDKMTRNGIRYICDAPEGVACVWDPDVYPEYWKKVEETHEETEINTEE